MSTVTTKNILLSQPKVGQNGDVSTVALTYTVSREELQTVVKIEVPGVDPDSIEVVSSHGALNVSCERGEAAFPIDPLVDPDEIKADILWGMLTLTIPSPKPPVTRSIKVSIHDVTKKKVTSKFTSED